MAWAVYAEQLEGDRWEVSFHAEIDEEWWSRAPRLGDMGPWPSSFAFDTLAHVIPQEGTREVSEHTIEGHDAVFDMTVRKFKHDVDFKRTADLMVTDVPFTGQFEYMTCNDEMCLPPATIYYSCNPDSGTFLLSTVPFDLSAYSVVTCADGTYKLESVDLDKPVVPTNRTDHKSSSLWMLFFLGFIGGLVALLTPCVFPMIPLTVSFFTKGSEDKADEA